MSTDLSRLDMFRIEVLNNIVLHNVALTATNNHGELPVVVALDDEPISIMLRRVANVGGNATLFSRGEKSVRMATFVNLDDALDPAAGEDMASAGNRPGSTASVGAFLDYVSLRGDGVKVSMSLGPDANRSEITDIQGDIFA